jgi:DNA repair photolyase
MEISSHIGSNNRASPFPGSLPSARPVGSPGPLETEMRSVIDRLTDSKYEDTFDWSVYDRIASKYAETPRGGVVFRTTFKLVNHHSICSKCHYAFEIDSYGRSCFHNCEYCYAKDQLSSHGIWNKPQPFPVDLAEVRKTFYTVFETSKSSKWRSILEKRIPLRIGSMSDSFMWLDTQYGVTKELLRILKFYRYPYVIFTRSDLVAHEDYIELLDRSLSSIQFSISGNNHALVRRMEPGAPGYSKRLAAIEKLAKSGFRTAVRINPLFPKYPDGFFTDPTSIVQRFGSRAAAPVLDLYDDNFIPQLCETGVDTILAGFVRLSPEAINRMEKVLKINLKQFFKPELYLQRGDKRYSDSEIAYYYGLMQKECRLHQVRFSTCYIGNGIKDYYQYQNLWSNKQDCCDIKVFNPGFEKTSQDIPWEKRITFSPNKTSAVQARETEEHFDLNDPSSDKGSESLVT